MRGEVIMKKLSLMVGVVLSFFVLGQVARAQSVENTGPGSNNTVNQETNTDCTVTNNNQVDVDNSNDQDTSTGDANNSGNTNGGDSTSGDANNDNSFDTDISIGNNQDCLPATSTSERPVGGMGGGAQVAATTTPQVKVTPVGGVGAGEGNPADLVRQLAVLLGSVGSLYFGFRRLAEQTS